jgi:protein TonB
MRPDRLIVVRAPSLAMPVVVSPPPPAVETVSAQPAEQPKPQTRVMPPAPPPPKAPEPGDAAAAPVEAPTGISAETGAEARTGGVEGGVPGGVPGGVVGGVVGGAVASGTGTASVVRVGASMQPPKKIKDVKPVFPAGALPSRSQGVVVIEAVIGTDGKIQDTKVLHSVPGLDQAAIDAVRQWEYTPSFLNGVAVAVVMTVVVNFAMQ